MYFRRSFSTLAVLINQLSEVTHLEQFCKFIFNLVKGREEVGNQVMKINVFRATCIRSICPIPQLQNCKLAILFTFAEYPIRKVYLPFCQEEEQIPANFHLATNWTSLDQSSFYICSIKLGFCRERNQYINCRM